jgi:hypothetical protein
MKSLSISLTVLALSATAWAKLPAPSEEAKAKAAEAAAKTAYTAKVEAYQLCKAQDRVVARTNKAATKSAGKDAKGAAPAASTCTDPGPFVYPLPQAPASAAVATAPIAPDKAKK